MGRMETLADLVNKHHWEIGAELGVYQGATTSYLLYNCPNLRLIAVDWWQRTSGPEPPNKETGHASYANKDMQAAEQKVRGFAATFHPRLVIYKMSTVKASAFVPDNSLDFVFVDASHVTEDVVQDIRVWERKVRVGGAVIGHDANWPSVQKALAICGYAPTEQPGNIWLQYKSERT